MLPIIVGNVILFATTWPLAANLERHHSQTSMELHMMFKMTFFQVFNTVFTAFLFLAVVKDRTCEEQASRTGVNMTDGNMTNVDPTSDCGTMQTFKRQWYELGGQLIVNNMFGDFIAMHRLLDFAGFLIDIVPMLLRAKLPFCCGSKRLAKWNINEWFAKRILPKLAHTQMAMDRLYIIRRDLYLAFRMQFAGKFVVICLMFSSAIPFLYLVGTAYFWLALWVDRYNLLRHVAPPPRTGPSLTVAMATFWFPLSIVLHLGLAIVFFIQHEGPQGSRVFSNHTAVETADRWAPPHTHSRTAPHPRAIGSPRFSSHQQSILLTDGRSGAAGDGAPSVLAPSGRGAAAAPRRPRSDTLVPLALAATGRKLSASSRKEWGSRSSPPRSSASSFSPSSAAASAASAGGGRTRRQCSGSAARSCKSSCRKTTPTRSTTTRCGRRGWRRCTSRRSRRACCRSGAAR